jgi:preprotein translocase subunit YajC
MILLQAAGNQGGMMQIILLVGFVGIFYFFFIRPQSQKQKKQRQFLDNLKKGESIVTIGGLHGKIIEVEANSLVIEIDKGVKVTIEKFAASFENTTNAYPTKIEAK